MSFCICKGDHQKLLEEVLESASEKVARVHGVRFGSGGEMSLEG